MGKKMSKNAMCAQSVSFLFTGARFAGLYYRADFGKESQLSEDLR